MAERPGMMIYFDDWKSLFSFISYEQLGRLLFAAIVYCTEEKEVVFSDDKALAMAWAMLKPKIDRDEARYYEKTGGGE